MAVAEIVPLLTVNARIVAIMPREIADNRHCQKYLLGFRLCNALEAYRRVRKAFTLIFTRSSRLYA